MVESGLIDKWTTQYEDGLECSKDETMVNGASLGDVQVRHFLMIAL